MRLLGIAAATISIGSAQALAAAPAPPQRLDLPEAWLKADESVDGYTAVFEFGRGESIDAVGVHVDRTTIDGVIERRDVAVIAAPARQTPSTSNMLSIPLNVPRTMLRAGMQRLVLRIDANAAKRLDGSAIHTRVIESKVNVYLPDRKSDAALQKRLEGTMVFPLGNVTMRCDPNVRPLPLEVNYPPPTLLASGAPFHIVRVERETGTAVVLRSGFGQSNSVETTFEYKAIDPLRIDFDAARDSRAGYITVGPIAVPNALFDQEVSSGRSFQSEMRQQLNRDGCKTIWLTTADEWDASLLLSIAPPSDRVAGDKQRGNDIRRGMSRDEVAFVLGLPSEFASRDEFNRRRVWNYVYPGPFSSTVFFRGRRVARYEPPGSLP